MVPGQAAARDVGADAFGKSIYNQKETRVC
ncbi:hypothetical protein SAMN06265173_106116 [Thalassovita litoralis]|jgi:hypothetical protein|uniref:Uncharacterized protein n=1 Tax=Thalassovita litoralis TaxID=1010611 RepID=A0A521CF12_9RHOB|nr:hypothetical protein SAMN06265173_106116 [Thalassovita litoralis]